MNVTSLASPQSYEQALSMNEVKSHTMTLEELLEHCSSPDSPQFNKAWTEFVNRYQRLIYNVILKRVNSWNDARVRLQKQDVVDDVYSEVLSIFYSNDFRVLRNFRAKDNERKFRSFLIITAHRAVGRYIQRHFGNNVLEHELEQIITYLKDQADLDLRWTLYEFVVQEIRKSSKTRRGNLERDINIFMLYVWAGFDHQMIAGCPHIPDIGHRVVDNVANRLRAILRESQKNTDDEDD